VSAHARDPPSKPLFRPLRLWSWQIRSPQKGLPHLGVEPAFLRTDENFIRTFLERDIPQLGINIPATTLRRFWTMIAHFHGQVWNAADLARSLGASEPTARRYLDILSSTFMVR